MAVLVDWLSSHLWLSCIATAGYLRDGRHSISSLGIIVVSTAEV